MTIVERVILESIAFGEKDFNEILGDTGLPDQVVANALPEMLMEELIFYKKGQYLLGCREKIKQASSNIKSEIKDVVSSLVDNYFDEKQESHSLKLQKISMTKREEKIFNSHMESLGEFIQQVQSNRSIDNEILATKNKKVIFWGHSDYESILNQALNIA